MREVKFTIYLPTQTDFNIWCLYVWSKFNNLIRVQGLKLLNKIWMDIKAKWIQSIVLFVIFGILIYSIDFSGALLITIFLAFAVYNWNNKVFAILALASLITCPILISYKKDELAENMAVYAYYFLAMTIGLELVSLRRAEQAVEEKSEVKLTSWFDFKMSNIFKVEIAPAVTYSPKIEIEKVVDDNEIVSDYKQYISDYNSVDKAVESNKFNDIFNSFIGWMADAVRITGRALSGNFDNIKREVVKMEKVVYTVPKMATSAVLAAAPDFTSFNLGKKVWRFIKIAARVVFTWQIFTNLAVAGVCLSFSYGALMAGDTARLIIKLGLSLFLVMAVNAIIYLNRK